MSVDARADSRAEDDEVEGRRNDRRDDALQQRAESPRHLEDVNRAYRVKVHAHSLTRSTNISSSELCLVWRSSNVTPASSRSARRPADVHPPGPANRRCRPARYLPPRAPAGSERVRPGSRSSRPCRLQRQLLLTQLAHKLCLLLYQDHLSLVDNTDPVSHLLGLVDVMGGQDDGHAIFAKPAHHLPHGLSQFDVDARRRLVEKQDSRLVREGFGDHDPALHAS